MHLHSPIVSLWADNRLGEPLRVVVLDVDVPRERLSLGLAPYDEADAAEARRGPAGSSDGVGRKRAADPTEAAPRGKQARKYK